MFDRVLIANRGAENLDVGRISGVGRRGGALQSESERHETAECCFQDCLPVSRHDVASPAGRGVDYF